MLQFFFFFNFFLLVMKFEILDSERGGARKLCERREGADVEQRVKPDLKEEAFLDCGSEQPAKVVQKIPKISASLTGNACDVSREKKHTTQ